MQTNVDKGCRPGINGRIGEEQIWQNIFWKMMS